MSEKTLIAKVLFVATLLGAPLIANPTFQIGLKGPHGGPLIRAAPKGSYVAVRPDGHRLYFELTKGKGEFSLYPYLLVSSQKDEARAVVPAAVLAEYTVTARAPESGRELRLEAIDDNAVRAVFTPLEAMQLGVRFGDPLVISIAVIHGAISKEAVFQTYYLR